MAVQLFFNGMIRAGEQIEMFEQAADGKVMIQTLHTNDQGIAMIPVQSGRAYMPDAVIGGAPTAKVTEETGTAYISLWANLTFAIPALVPASGD